MEQDDNNNQNGFPVYSISKSSEAIHFKPDPKTEITLGASKAFNAVSYLMQVKARRAGLSPAAFNQQLGNSSVELVAGCQDFMRLIGCNSKNYAYLDKLVQETGKMRAVWSNEANNEELDSGFMNMFTAGRIHKSMVHFIIPPETRALLLAERPVAVIEFISLHERINSKYGMALNDLVEQEMFDAGVAGKTFMIEDHKLRNALKLKSKIVDGKTVYAYPYPTDLLRKVLNVAVPDYNQAELNHRITNYTYDKVMGSVIWTFTVITKQESEKRLVASQFSDDILAVNTALIDFKMAEAKRSQIITSIADEYELHYLLFCVQQTKETPNVENKAAYFLKCVEKNRDAFAAVWDVRRLEKENERFEKAARHQAVIVEQKENFKRQFIKAVGNSYAESYQSSKQFSPQFEVLFKAHCAKMGRALKANEILDAVNSKQDFDFLSPVYLGFCATWVTEHMTDKLAEFVNNQTIILPTD